MNKKSPAKSKTILINAALGAVSIVPQVRDFISQNPEAAAIGSALLNIGLRAITKDKIGFGAN